MASLIDFLITDGRFNTLVSAIQAANLSGTLAGGGPYTLFAPTDEAFSGMPDAALADLLADVPQLTDLLLYHLVPGHLTVRDLSDRDELPTLVGQPIRLQKLDGKQFVNDAMIVGTEKVLDNGVIHRIDTVLLPSLLVR